MKFKPAGRFEWHGIMLCDGEETPFVTFADDMGQAVKNFDTLPDDAIVVALERGNDVGDLEFDGPDPRGKMH